MGGGATGGDVMMATEAIIEAIEQCCCDEIEFFEMTAMNIGMGLEACCTAWKEAGVVTGGSVADTTIPGAGPPDANGNPTDLVIPGKAYPAAATWGDQAAQQAANACHAANVASTLYATQYNAWLASYEKWQELQVIPQLVAFGLQVVALTKMYEQWTMYLKKTNKIMCGLADEVFPCAKANYLAIKGDLNAHIEDYKTMVMGAEGEELTSYADKVAWHCELGEALLECWQGDGEGQAGYKTIAGQHTQNMAQHLANICEAGQWAIQDAKTCVTKFKADVDNNFTQWGIDNFNKVGAEVEQLYDKAADICAFLNECGMAMANNYVNEASPEIQANLAADVDNAALCLEEIQGSIADAEECMQIQKDLYEVYRDPLQTYFAAEVINEVNNMLLSGTIIQDCEQFAADCAAKFKDKYELIYEPNEDELANKILQMACRLAENTEEEHEWQKDLSRLCLAHWEDHYEDCDGVLGEGIMQEAKLLYATRKETFDEFVEHHNKLWDFWCNHYQNLENDFSFDLITKATEQVCEWKIALDKLCDEACEFLDWWKDYYSAEECLTAPKLIAAGRKACDQQQETYMKLDGMLDDLCNKWFEEVCGCEITDIQELCKLHEKAEVACEINDNAQCVQEIAEQLKDCYLRVGLQCEKDYLQELCDMEKYDPEYCNLEDRALLHIRSRFDKARENLLRNSNRYCVGNTEHQLCKLETEQARLEAQAIESANRFERWWAVRECDRRHRYKLDMIQVYQGMAAMAIEGFSNTTQQYDMILTQIHNRLNRAYQMISQANQSGSIVAQSTAQGVSQSLDTIRTGQHYTDLFYRMKAEFNRSSGEMALRAQEQTRIGQQYGSMALDSLQRAENTANSAVNQGIQAMEHGFRFKQFSLDASRAAQQTTMDAQNLGLQYIDRGHRVQQYAREWKSLDWQMVCDSIQKAQRQVDQAQNTLNQAFAFEQHRDALIQQCRSNGMEASRHQLDLFNAGIGKVERAMAASENGIRAAYEMINWGQGQRQAYQGMLHNMGTLVTPSVQAYNQLQGQGLSMLSIAAQQNQMGMQAKQMELDKLCEMLRAREAMVCQKLLGFNAVGNSVANLAGQFGGGVSSAAEGLIGSVQGFVGQAPSMLGGPVGGGTNNIFTTQQVVQQQSQNPAAWLPW